MPQVSIQEVADYIGVDSLGYLSLAGLARAIRLEENARNQPPTNDDKPQFMRNERRGFHEDEQELKYLQENFCYGCMHKEGWPFDPIVGAKHGVQRAIFFPRDTVGKKIK